MNNLEYSFKQFLKSKGALVVEPYTNYKAGFYYALSLIDDEELREKLLTHAFTERETFSQNDKGTFG